MKFIIFFGLIALSIISVLADCNYKGKLYKVGESWKTDGHCSEIKCTGDNELKGKDCGVYAVANPDEYDYIPEDPTKPFPECCSSYKKKKH